LAAIKEQSILSRQLSSQVMIRIWSLLIGMSSLVIRMCSLIRAHEQGRQGAGECVVGLVIDVGMFLLLIRMCSLISEIIFFVVSLKY